MGNINIGHLYKKRTVRSLSGNIIDMVDESNGGVIISRGNVVNQERIDELARLEKDRQTAAQAASQPAEVPQELSEQRVAPPTKLQEMEKRIEAQDAKLDAILAALKK